MLTLIDREGSSRALRIHRSVRHMIRTLSLPEGWQLEVAAMLSHLGFLTLSTPASPIVGAEGSDGEPPAAHAAVACALLKHIPRLDAVAEIIGRQQDPVDPRDVDVPLPVRDAVRRGGQVLNVAIEFDAAISVGLSRDAALAHLRRRPSEFDRAIVNGLRDVELPKLMFEPRLEALADLRQGMILDEDLRNDSGLLFMARGQEITLPVLLKREALASRRDIQKCVQVLARRSITAPTLLGPSSYAAARHD